MTCLFCRCNTWASKHRPATIKSKQQTVPCPIQYSEGGGWEAHVICPSKFFSLQPSSVFTSQTNTFLNFTIATLTIPPTTLSPLLSAGLPAATTTFIHTLRSLAYSKGQRSATMTTSSSTNRRPPINTSDTCGVKKEIEENGKRSSAMNAFWIKKKIQLKALHGGLIAVYSLCVYYKRGSENSIFSTEIILGFPELRTAMSLASCKIWG